MNHITQEQASDLAESSGLLGCELEEFEDKVQALCNAAIEWHISQTKACDMGAMCLNCQPRGPHGECPDKMAPKVDAINTSQKCVEETAKSEQVPLTVQEVEQILAQHNYELHGDRARYIVRMTEQAHGIGGKV